jgi:hypothetical protein
MANTLGEKVLTDPANFKADLLRILAISGDELAAYIEKMRNYRDKFLAHLDDLPVMDIPFLDRAHAAVELYHRHITKREIAIGDLSQLPTDLAAYYVACFEEARRIYDRCLS